MSDEENEDNSCQEIVSVSCLSLSSGKESTLVSERYTNMLTYDILPEPDDMLHPRAENRTQSITAHSTSSGLSLLLHIVLHQ